MKKILLAPLLLLALVANETNEQEIKKLSPEEQMIKHPDSFEKYHPKNGYMPDIITPDEEKSGVYGGLALSSDLLESSNSFLSNKNYMLNLNLIAGYNYNKYVAFESRLSTSLAYDNGVDFSTWSIFVKPKYELYDSMNLYSLIGIGGFDAKSINSKKLKSKKNNLQVGVGADYKLGNNFKIFADYIYMGKDAKAKMYDSQGKTKASSFTTGITYDF